MIENYTPKLAEVLKEIETSKLETNTTVTGSLTIKQGLRNELRKVIEQSLMDDLTYLYPDYSVLLTKDGLVIAAENQDDYTVSIEIKTTIKTLDYDPFIAACNYEEELQAKAEKKKASEQEKAEKIRLLEEKRAKKLAEIKNKK